MRLARIHIIACFSLLIVIGKLKISSIKNEMLFKALLMMIIPVISLCQIQPNNVPLPGVMLRDLLSLSQLYQNDHFTQDIVPRQILDYPVVDTTSGLLIGSTTSEGHGFYSVPFGEAPIGDLRYKDPVPFISTNEINASMPDYTKCYQFPTNCSTEEECYEKYKMTEDCLVLNVFVPPFVDLTNLPTEELPVMVWIYGGAYFTGSGTHAIYDATWLSATTGTIIVAGNYRLDALGFLFYEEDCETFDGFQGIRDQQLTLRWVQDNIENFGGDKSKVTIFGESAGAQSVMIHLMSPISKPLFQRAIMQSNPAAFFYPTRAEAASTTAVLLDVLGCQGSGLDCLLQTCPTKLIKAHSKVMLYFGKDMYALGEPYRPVLESEGISQQPLTVFETGEWNNDKEVIIGVTSEEFAIFIGLFFPSGELNKFQFQLLVRYAVGPEYAQVVIDEYLQQVGDPGMFYDYTNLTIQESTDQVFACATRRLARSMSKTSAHCTPPIYLYVDYHPITGDLCDFMQPCDYAMHSSDVIFTFKGGSTGIPLSEDDMVVTNLINKFWGNFAHYGSPNNNTQEWPPYLSHTVGNVAPWTNMRLEATGAKVESNYRGDICDFWDSIGYFENH